MLLTEEIGRLLVRELEGFTREVALFPDDDALWRVAPGVTNSAGNLALHVAGNLQHFVGAALGGRAYVRDRDAEFTTRRGTRDDVTRELRTAIDALTATLATLDQAALAKPMPAAPNGMVVRTSTFLLHLVAHTGFHLGQAGYIRRVVTGKPTSAHPLPLDVIATQPS